MSKFAQIVVSENLVEKIKKLPKEGGKVDRDHLWPLLYSIGKKQSLSLENTHHFIGYVETQVMNEIEHSPPRK